MIKNLMFGAAVSALMVSGALAQSPPSAQPATSSPPVSAAPKAPAAGQQAVGKPEIVTSQKPEQWLATRFRGTDVVGSDAKKIGAVSDILFDKNGKIEAYVVSIGGFLGMGAKDVALAPSSFDVIRGANGAPDKLKLSMNKNELQQAQNFTPYQPPRPTTIGSGGGSPAGLPGAMRPSTNTRPTGQ